MGIGSTFCQLGRLLDAWDREGVTIDAVTVADETALEAGANQTAEVTLSLPMQSSEGDCAVECTPDVTAGGSIALSLETNVEVPETMEDVIDVEATDAALCPDGTVNLTVSTTVMATDGYGDSRAADFDDQANERWSNANDGNSERAGDDQAESDDDAPRSKPGRSRDVPPFRDPELLQEVYDTHDTFAEMAEALDMDVTGETVRRYMIDYDIHQPNSYRTKDSSVPTASSDGQSPDADSGQEAVILSDGIGLPEGVSVEDVIETVNRSNTIYEVKEDLGLERKEAHEMLKELNLIDLVLGRLSNDAGREITRDDVIQRLREVSRERQQETSAPVPTT